MNYKQFKKKYTQEDIDRAQEILEDYADAIETEEPFATISINRLREASSSISNSLED